MTSENSYKFKAQAELLFEKCLTSAPSAGFVVIDIDRETQLITLADEIVHGISLEIHVKEFLTSSRLIVRTSGSMAIIGQPRRMHLISAIKRGLRN